MRECYSPSSPTGSEEDGIRVPAAPALNVLAAPQPGHLAPAPLECLVQRWSRRCAAPPPPAPRSGTASSCCAPRVGGQPCATNLTTCWQLVLLTKRGGCVLLACPAVHCPTTPLLNRPHQHVPAVPGAHAAHPSAVPRLYRPASWQRRRFGAEAAQELPAGRAPALAGV